MHVQEVLCTTQTEAFASEPRLRSRAHVGAYGKAVKFPVLQRGP